MAPSECVVLAVDTAPAAVPPLSQPLICLLFAKFLVFEAAESVQFAFSFANLTQLAMNSREHGDL